MASNESSSIVETKPPQISADILTDLNLTQADVESHRKNKELFQKAETALAAGDWKTAIDSYDQAQPQGIGSTDAHDFRVKVASMFKESTETRLQIAEHIQSLVDAKGSDTSETYAPKQAETQTIQSTIIKPELPTIPTPEVGVTNAAPLPIVETPNITAAAPPTETLTQPTADTLAPAPTPQIEPKSNIIKFPHLPHLAGARTSPAAPEPTPILNVSGEANINPQQTATEDLRPAPVNPLAA